MKKHIDLLLISVDSPILLGIYDNKKLIKSFSKEGKFSDSLPNLFGEVFAEYFGGEMNLSSSANRAPISSSVPFLSLRGRQPEAIQKKSPQDEFALDIYYANGPGNFSAIKLTHIFLQTLQISLNALSTHESNTAKSNHTNPIRLFCTDAFHFSDSEFINAYGKIHFYKADSAQGKEICTTTLESKRANSFSLPKTLDTSIFSDECAPLYILPAV